MVHGRTGTYSLLVAILTLGLVDPGVSEIEKKDETLCHSDSTGTLSCPDNSFIDMLPGGEYSPLAVFIEDFSCPDAGDRHTVLSNINLECQREATDLLKSCHGEKECSLDPSYARLELKNTMCPSIITNFIFFSYRCFYLNPQNNVAVMEASVRYNAVQQKDIIIGAAVGGVLLLSIIAILVVLFMRERAKTKTITVTLPDDRKVTAKSAQDAVAILQRIYMNAGNTQQPEQSDNIPTSDNGNVYMELIRAVNLQFEEGQYENSRDIDSYETPIN